MLPSAQCVNVSFQHKYWLLHTLVCLYLIKVSYLSTVHLKNTVVVMSILCEIISIDLFMSHNIADTDKFYCLWTNQGYDMIEFSIPIICNSSFVCNSKFIHYNTKIPCEKLRFLQCIKLLVLNYFENKRISLIWVNYN